jgi:hypothetical protein
MLATLAHATAQARDAEQDAVRQAAAEERLRIALYLNHQDMNKLFAQAGSMP